MLQAFLDSVKSSKRRRRLVKTLDLLSSPQKKVTLSTVFDTYDVCQIPLGQEFRYNDTVFTELFAMFKNLEVIRIYGGPLLTDGIKAHWKSLSYTLSELKIYNLGSLTDNGILELVGRLSPTLKHLHLEHPKVRTDQGEVAEIADRDLRVGTIDHILKLCPALKSLGIGIALRGIKNDKSFLERMFDLESVTFLRVPDIDFESLMLVSLSGKWESLVVRDCPGMQPEGLEAVLKRLPKLVNLDWRFPVETYYDWTDHELKTAGCRRLKSMIVENGYFSDQCLMRIFRVLSNLETLALSNCGELHRIRPTCAHHYVLQECTGLLQDIYEVFEECLFDVRSITFIKQKYTSEKQLITCVNWMFRDARDLEFIEFRECSIGLANHSEDFFCKQLSNNLVVQLYGHGSVIRVRSNGTTIRRSRGEPTRNGINLLSFHARASAMPSAPLPSFPLQRLYSSTDSRTIDAPNAGWPFKETTASRKGTSSGSVNSQYGPDFYLNDLGESTSSADDLHQQSDLESSSISSTSSESSASKIPAHEKRKSALDNPKKDCESSEAWPEFSVNDIYVTDDHEYGIDLKERKGWPSPRKQLQWGDPEFEIVQRQRKTRFWNAESGVVAEAEEQLIQPSVADNERRHGESSTVKQWNLQPQQTAMMSRRSTYSAGMFGVIERPKSLAKDVRPRNHVVRVPRKLPSTRNRHPARAFTSVRTPIAAVRSREAPKSKPQPEQYGSLWASRYAAMLTPQQTDNAPTAQISETKMSQNKLKAAGELSERTQRALEVAEAAADVALAREQVCDHRPSKKQEPKEKLESQPIPPQSVVDIFETPNVMLQLQVAEISRDLSARKSTEPSRELLEKDQIEAQEVVTSQGLAPEERKRPSSTQGPDSWNVILPERFIKKQVWVPPKKTAALEGSSKDTATKTSSKHIGIEPTGEASVKVGPRNASAAVEVNFFDDVTDLFTYNALL